MRFKCVDFVAYRIKKGNKKVKEMRKRIFLTSILALTVASPAFADGWDSLDMSTFGLARVNSDNEVQGAYNGAGLNSGYIGNNNVTSAACQAAPLTLKNSAPGSGTFTFTAQWERDECSISLDPNNTNGGDATENANYSESLYTTYGIGAYLEAARTNLMTTSSNPLTTTRIPTGQTITTKWYANMPSDAPAGSSVSLSGTAITDVNDPNGSGVYDNYTRAFTGFYADPTSGDQYISNTGYITGDGDDEAKDITKANGVCPTTTWYAHWDCTTKTDPEPTLTGYVFDGWYTSATPDSSDKPVGSNRDVCADETLYAKWRKRVYSVTYDCGSQGSMNSPVLPSWDFSEVDPVTGFDTGTDHVTYNETVYEFRDVEDVCTPGANVQWNSTNPWICTDEGGASVEPVYDNANDKWLRASDVHCTANPEGLYSLSYNCGDAESGSVAPTGGSYTENTQLTIVNNDPETNCKPLTGKHFTGWSCNALREEVNGTNASVAVVISGADLLSNSYYMPDTAVTCTAQWDNNVVYLLWDSDNGAGDTNAAGGSGSCIYSTESGTGAITVPTTEPTRTGYTFKGWKVTNHCDGQETTPNVCTQ